MAECIGCGADLGTMEINIPGCSGIIYGLCEQCCADLQLGRMVRNMPRKHALFHDKNWFLASVTYWGKLIKTLGGGDTPEAAIEEAMKGDGE